MPSEPTWLQPEAVIEINKVVVSSTGENHALLFPDRLDGALGRPYNAFLYGGVYDTVSLTVNLMVAVGQAHAFEQGNKRTAFFSGLTFMYENGYGAQLPDTVDFATHFEDVILNRMAPEDFEVVLKPHVFPLNQYL